MRSWTIFGFLIFFASTLAACGGTEETSSSGKSIFTGGDDGGGVTAGGGAGGKGGGGNNGNSGDGGDDGGDNNDNNDDGDDNNDNNNDNSGGLTFDPFVSLSVSGQEVDAQLSSLGLVVLDSNNLVVGGRREIFNMNADGIVRWRRRAEAQPNDGCTLATSSTSVGSPEIYTSPFISMTRSDVNGDIQRELIVGDDVNDQLCVFAADNGSLLFRVAASDLGMTSMGKSVRNLGDILDGDGLEEIAVSAFLSPFPEPPAGQTAGPKLLILSPTAGGGYVVRQEFPFISINTTTTEVGSVGAYLLRLSDGGNPVNSALIDIEVYLPASEGSDLQLVETYTWPNLSETLGNQLVGPCDLNGDQQREEFMTFRNTLGIKVFHINSITASISHLYTITDSITQVSDKVSCANLDGEPGDEIILTASSLDGSAGSGAGRIFVYSSLDQQPFLDIEGGAENVFFGSAIATVHGVNPFGASLLIGAPREGEDDQGVVRLYQFLTD